MKSVKSKAVGRGRSHRVTRGCKFGSPQSPHFNVSHHGKCFQTQAWDDGDRWIPEAHWSASLDELGGFKANERLESFWCLKKQGRWQPRDNSQGVLMHTHVHTYLHTHVHLHTHKHIKTILSGVGAWLSICLPFMRFWSPSPLFGGWPGEKQEILKNKKKSTTSRIKREIQPLNRCLSVCLPCRVRVSRASGC